MGEKLQITRRIIASIPGIGERLAETIYTKTYFEADTETMFRSGIHGCVLGAIETITGQHGHRQLSEVERRRPNTLLKK